MSTLEFDEYEASLKYSGIWSIIYKLTVHDVSDEDFDKLLCLSNFWDKEFFGKYLGEV
jgi:hypothetical protein